MADRLLTIPVSHFCEKARWALDLAGVPYVEEGWPPAVHRFAIRRHRATTVPLLIREDGAVLRESGDIVRYASDRAPELGLFGEDPEAAAEIEALVARFDRGLGPAARLLVYAATLDDPSRFLDVLGAGLPARRRALLRGVRPLAALVIRRHLGVDEDGVRRAQATLTEELAFADARRAGSPYLVGGRFTAADLTFAALAAPLALPPEYGGPALSHHAREAAPLESLAPWRNTPGAGVLTDLYRRHRV